MEDLKFMVVTCVGCNTRSEATAPLLWNHLQLSATGVPYAQAIARAVISACPRCRCKGDRNQDIPGAALRWLVQAARSRPVISARRPSCSLKCCPHFARAVGVIVR